MVKINAYRLYQKKPYNLCPQIAGKEEETPVWFLVKCNIE